MPVTDQLLECQRAITLWEQLYKCYSQIGPIVVIPRDQAAALHTIPKGITQHQIGLNNPTCSLTRYPTS